MILVAGLVIMGLAGIAAAFYFSMRPGHSPDRAVPERGRSRGSAARGSRPGGSRPAASRGRTAPSALDRAVRPRRTAPAGDRTGPSTVLDFTDPHLELGPPGSLVAGRPGRRGDQQHGVAEDAAAQQLTALSARQDDEADAGLPPRSRRRVAWHKGADVDQELWPAEEFGGVSDEQFWNDLAADRPLATTARTAQPDTAARRRPPQAGRLPDLPPGEAGRRAAGRRTDEGWGTYPQRSQGAEDRTAAQPTFTAQPATAAQPSMAAQPTGTAPLTASSPGHQGRAAYQAAPGRSPAAASAAAEDPLTSPAYALRPKGAVDGSSRGWSPRPRDAGGPGAGRSRPEADWTSPLPSERSWPGASASGSYPGAPASGSYPGAPASGSYPGAPASGSYPGAPASGSYPGAPASGSYPGAPASGSYPGAPASGSYRGAPASDDYPAAPAPGPYPGASAPGGTAANPAYRPGSSDSSRGSTAYLYPQAYREPLGAADTAAYGYSDQSGPPGDSGYANGWNPGPAGGGEASRGARPAHPSGSGYRAPYDSGGR